MRISKLFIAGMFACASIAPVIAPAAGQDNNDDFDPMTVNVSDAIMCKIDAPTYNSFALSIGSDWKKRGWQKIETKNSFLNEYRLPAPINVAGMQTRHIAFSASAVMAVLDIADPNIVAKPEGITNDVDPAAFFKDMKLTPEQIKDIPKTNKFLGQKILIDTTEKDAELNMQFHTVIARTISNVRNLPNKTLYGCSYNIEMLDAAGKPL